MVILYTSYDYILSDDQLINQCKGSVNSGSPFMHKVTRNLALNIKIGNGIIYSRIVSGI